ncbi:peptidogalycan biosysnthesis protein [Acinetobacter equi]|uniref:ATP synthase subunit alpha n=1 Tax=Acinetobacter equi TaxID=1324350 RepID=A0A0N9W2S0_9GAMM|nr:GNAT family N-acetyltransferase [Acinetobacter equi]ALH95896.1 ATP synthase subunit alpha [Acinetobacter equi]
MTRFLNQLEPQSLVDAFLKHPPQDFELYLEKEIPAFTMQFNLLTTLDSKLKKKIENIYGYKRWKNFITFQTCFMGTTVTEYSPLCAQKDINEAIRLFKEIGKEQSLTIIKDLPLNSPLLSDLENKYSQNLIEYAKKQGFFVVEGQALAYVPINFINREDYLSKLSKSRRKNLKRKLKCLDYLRIEWVKTGTTKFQSVEFCKYLYSLYFSVYQQSEIHFDLLTINFFNEILLDAESGGCVALYWFGEELVGYNICYEYQDNLIDKYIGFNYELALKFNLYFVSWFVNLDYALERNLKYYIAGWTDPEVKAQLGAKFTFTTHLVWVRQPILRQVLKPIKHIFEADKKWFQLNT